MAETARDRRYSSTRACVEFRSGIVTGTGPNLPPVASKRGEGGSSAQTPRPASMIVTIICNDAAVERGWNCSDIVKFLANGRGGGSATFASGKVVL